MEISKKVLASIFMIGLLAFGLGWGTYSYFSDTETSTGNVFTAGTIDLLLSNDGGSGWHDGVTATWSISGWAPGDYYEDVLYAKNVGTTGAVVGRFKGLDLVESGPEAPNDIADHIYITTIEYTEDGVWMPWNLAGYYATIMGNNLAPLTLREFCDSAGYSMVFWTGEGMPGDSGIDYFPAGGTWEALKLGFTFDSGAGNAYQGDSATFTLRVTADDDPAILGKGSTGCYGY